MQTAWYCVNSNPRCEEQAVRHLDQQGFATYFPLVKSVGKHGDVVSPMFTNYLFVAFDVRNPSWRSIGRGTVGVKRLMMTDEDSPQALPFGFVEGLQDRLGGGNVYDLRPPVSQGVKAGDSVCITSGVFAGHRGYCQLASKKRLMILLNTLGQRHAVSIPRKQVALVVENLLCAA